MHDAREAEILSWLEQQQAPMLGAAGRARRTPIRARSTRPAWRAPARSSSPTSMARGLPCELIAQGDGSVSIRSTLPPARARREQRSRAAARPPRHGVPQGHRGGAPVPGRGRPRLRAGRRRHEGGPGDERLRARGLRAGRRRHAPRGRAVHLRRGDRVARLAPDDRGRRPRRPRGLQRRARPPVRQHRLGPQGGDVPDHRGHRQARPFRLLARPGHQRDRGALPQGPGAPRADRLRNRHHAQCRPDRGRPVDQHGRPARRPRGSTSASRRWPRWPRPKPRSSRFWRRPTSPAPPRRITAKAAFLPFEPTPASQALFDHYVAAAAELGQTVGGEYTGGSADSGFTAAVGAPTVCGIGPIGEKAHSPDEVCHVDTLIPRAKTLALAISRLET